MSQASARATTTQVRQRPAIPSAKGNASVRHAHARGRESSTRQEGSGSRSVPPGHRDGGAAAAAGRPRARRTAGATRSSSAARGGGGGGGNGGGCGGGEVRGAAAATAATTGVAGAAPPFARWRTDDGVSSPGRPLPAKKKKDTERMNEQG